MRPIHLTMSAFGPYAGVVDIPMEQLGQSGVYLITGNTGAGKTTIFDAIKFALFGEASGDSREAGMLRSKYAENRTATYVELIFEYDRKRYVIKRNPAYQRLKERGEGFTEQKAEAVLTDSDGKVITGAKQVTMAVRAVMGIDAKQFSQIAMIAQGQFKELLLASTEKRVEIFREIFKTAPFLRLQKEVREDAANLERQREELRRGLLQYLKGVTCKIDSRYEERLTKVKENQEVPVFSVIENLVELIIREDKTGKEELDKAALALEKQMTQISILISQADADKKLRDELADSKRLLEHENEQLNTWADNLRIQEEKSDQQETLLVEIQLLMEQLTEYDEKDHVVLELKKIREHLVKQNSNQEKTIESINHNREFLQKAEDDLNRLGNIELEILQVEHLLSDYNEQQERAATLISQAEQLENIQKKLKAAREQLEEALNMKKEITDRFTQMEYLFLTEQAGILASRLVDGEMCPVCGSVHHPEIAKLAAGAPSEAELKAVKTEMTAAAERVEECALTTKELSVNEEQMKNQLKQMLIAVFGSEKIEDFAEQAAAMTTRLKRQIIEANSQLTGAKKQLEKKRELEIQLPVWKEKQLKIEQTLKSYEDNIIRLNTQLESAQKELLRYETRLEYQSRKEAAQQIEIKKEYKKKLEAAYTEAKTTYDKSRQRIGQYQASIAAYEKQLAGQEKVESAELQNLKNTLEGQKAMLERQKSDLQTRIKINNTALHDMRDEYQSMKAVEEKWQWIKALSDTLGGRMRGKEKVELETYVQMAYFDRIIERANLRFMVMSYGQFELKRKREADNRTSKSGLDLDVIDHYNGSQRSVNTLSGGESFKASLALALGLSDEIQASAGGIHLDTMFIDEGFGSLDEESLEQAMKILNNLSAGNRLVGIISHVTELKDRIDRQIVVTKEKCGGSGIAIIR